MNFLCHVCDHKVDVLDPKNYEQGTICFSEDCFVGYMGQWLYVFDKTLLIRKYNASRFWSGGAVEEFHFDPVGMNGLNSASFRGQDLGVEYRVSRLVSVSDAVLVLQNFAADVGELSYKFTNRVVKEHLNKL